MHELSLVETLIKQVENEVQESGHEGRIVGLEIIIGRFSGVNANSFRFAFELLSPDTKLAGAELHIDEPRAVCRCEYCDSETETEELLASCPVCDSPHITIVGGQELKLSSIDLEE